MPRGDRTGPAGMGPMTGRAAGYCAGYNAPGAADQGTGMGYGRGGGRGMAWRRGRGGGGYAVPAYPPQAAAYGWPAAPVAAPPPAPGFAWTAPPAAAPPPAYAAGSERSALAEQVAALQNQLNWVQDRLQALSDEQGTGGEQETEEQ